MRRVGVEEEFLVADADGAVVPDAATVIALATPMLGDRVGGEITKMQVETRTDPCTSIDELHAQLDGGRAAVRDAAAAAALRMLPSGSPVLGRHVPAPITEGPRQDRGNAMFRGLHDDLAICSVHVHVEEPDRDRAARISNHLRPHLPVLLALTANSPFWAERDTGYASWRSLTLQRWPVCGPPPYVESAAEYDAHVRLLLDAGAMVDKGTLFWDVRLSAHVPTIEIRVADMPMTAAESAGLAALVRALVVTAGAAVDAGDLGPQVSAGFLRLAYWRAARDGMTGHGIDALTGRLHTADALARRLADTARPALVAAGDDERVDAWLDGLAATGDGAARQRAAAARRGELGDVADILTAGLTAPSEKSNVT